MFTEASDTGGEIHQVSSRSRRILRKLIDGRASSQHRTAQAHSLVGTERHSQLTHVLHGVLPQIITKGNVNLISGIDELHDRLLTLDTQTTSIPSQLIQTFPRSASIELFELFIHLMDLFRCLTRIFTHVLHLLIHGSKRFHASTNGESEASHGTNSRDSSSLDLIEEIGRTVQKRLLGCTLISHALQLSPESLCFCLQLFKRLGTTRRFTEFFIDDLDGILQVSNICGREMSQRIIHQIRFSFHLSHVLCGLLDLLVVFVNLMNDLLLLVLNLLETGFHLVQLLDSTII